MLFIMLKNVFSESNLTPTEYDEVMDEISKFVIKPIYAIAVNLFIGFIFFVLSVIIDSRR